MLAETVGWSTGAPTLELVDVHLPVVEPEEVPVPRVPHVELRRCGGQCPADEVRVRMAVPSRARLGRRHVDPGRRAIVEAPCVRNSDRNDAARAGQEHHASAVEVQRRRAFQDEEALLERVDVRLDVPVLEAAEPEAHVHGPGRAVDERRAREPLARRLVLRCEDDLLAALQVVHACLLTASSSRRRHRG